MTPGEMSERLAASVASESTGRRVVCVEDEGPRRTWTLHESGRQVGLVRMRRLPWTVEASDRTRVMLGLDTEARPGQAVPEEGSQ